MLRKPGWTGVLAAYMHVEDVRMEELAEEAGLEAGELSAILNGKPVQDETRERIAAAYERLVLKKDRREKGLSDDLKSLMHAMRELDPEYAERLSHHLGMSG